MNYNFSNIPGYGSLRFDPQMPYAQLSGLANTRGSYGIQAPNYIDPNSAPDYMMSRKWQFGPNYQHIAFSNALQSIGAFMRGNNQRKDFRSYNQAQMNPLSQLPENPNTTDQALYGMREYKKGGKVKYENGGRFDNFDDFDEDDFQDLKDELDRYFKDKDSSSPIQDKEDDKVEEKQDDQQPEQDDYQPSQAMNFLMGDEEAYQGEEQSDKQIADQLAGIAPIPQPQQTNSNDLEAFKKGIAGVENAAYGEGNKNSSAFGKYQFTAGTREAVREKFFSNISKKDFEFAYKNDPNFQEKVMDAHGSDLLRQFGDPHKAATAFFLGPGKANMYNQPSYNPGNGNISVGQYLKIFDKGYTKKQGGHIGISPGSVSTGFDIPYNFKMEEGGPGPGVNINSTMNTKSNGSIMATILDNINRTLVNGKLTRTGDPIQDQLSMSAYLWRNQSKGKTPEQMISSFYSRPIDENNQSDILRRTISKMNNSPVASYYDTPDITVKSQFKEGGEYELTDIQIAQLKKAGYKIEII